MFIQRGHLKENTIFEDGETTLLCFYSLYFIGCLWFIEFDLRTEKIVKELKKSTKI